MIILEWEDREYNIFFSKFRDQNVMELINLEYDKKVLDISYFHPEYIPPSPDHVLIVNKEMSDLLVKEKIILLTGKKYSFGRAFLAKEAIILRFK